MASEQSQAEKLPNFAKYGKISAFTNAKEVKSLAGRDVQVFEKVDGGNCQVRNLGWRLVAGNKANFLVGKGVIARRPWFGKLTQWLYSNASLYSLPNSVIPFGEWSGNHTIKYSPENTDKFFLIDLKDLESGRFLPYEQGRAKIENLGIEGMKFLKPIFTGRITPELVKHLLLKEQSEYYNGPKEGLVIKDYDAQQFFKILHPEFAEKREALDGRVEYLTPGRYTKAFHALNEDRDSFSIDDIAKLVKEDILEEESHIVSYADARRMLERMLANGKPAVIHNHFYH